MSEETAVIDAPIRRAKQDKLEADRLRNFTQTKPEPPKERPLTRSERIFIGLKKALLAFEQVQISIAKGGDHATTSQRVNARARDAELDSILREVAEAIAE